MPEITTRLGPLRLRWDIEYTTAGKEIIEVFASLAGISDDAFWQRTKREPQWTKASHNHHVWKIYWELIESDERCKPSDERCREAIERERADLAREDAERIGDIIRESRT